MERRDSPCHGFRCDLVGLGGGEVGPVAKARAQHSTGGNSSSSSSSSSDSLQEAAPPEVEGSDASSGSPFRSDMYSCRAEGVHDDYRAASLRV